MKNGLTDSSNISTWGSHENGNVLGNMSLLIEHSHACYGVICWMICRFGTAMVNNHIGGNGGFVDGYSRG